MNSLSIRGTNQDVELTVHTQHERPTKSCYDTYMETNIYKETFDDPTSKGKLALMQINATGLNGKIEEILEIMVQRDIAVTFISETWLKQGQHPHPCVKYVLSGCLPERLLSHQPHGLGIMIHPYYLHKLDTDVVEILHVSQDPNPVYGPFMVLCRIFKTWIVLFSYMNPNKTTDTCCTDIIKYVDKSLHATLPHIILGDLNMRLGELVGDTVHNARGLAINELLENHGYSLCKYSNHGAFTFMTDHGRSIADYFYINSSKINAPVSCTVLDTEDIGSDHIPCAMSIECRTSSPSQTKNFYMWNIKKLKDDEYKDKFTQAFISQVPSVNVHMADIISKWTLAGRPVFDHNASEVSERNSIVIQFVEDMYDFFYMALEQACQISIGKQKRTKKHHNNWFMDTHLRKLINCRKKTYNLWKRSTCSVRRHMYWKRYKHYKSIVQKECQRKRKQAFEEWVDSTEILNTSECTKIISGITKKRSGKSSSALDTSEASMSVYKNHYMDIFTPLTSSPIDDQCTSIATSTSCPSTNTIMKHQKTLDTFWTSTKSPLDISLAKLKEMVNQSTLTAIGMFSPDIVSQTIKFFPKAKAPGESGVVIEMLCPIATHVAPILSIMYTFFYISGHVPSSWCKSLVCPIYKKGQANDIANYRPISLTETLRKVYEKLLHPVLQSYIEPLSKFQNGFRSYKNTIDHVATLQYIIQRSGLKKNEHLKLAFLDIKSAYDKVNRVHLWRKCSTRGIPTEMISTIKALFDYNTSKLCIYNHTSEPFPIKAGLLQGSVLSPMLYSLFIDDLAESLQARGPSVSINNDMISINCLFYADDIVLISRAYEDLKVLLAICEEHAMTNDYMFNSRKCELLCTPSECREISTSMDEIMLHRIPLTRTNRFKYLGVYFTCKGIDTETQIMETSSKARRQANLLASIGVNGHGYSYTTNMNIYKSMIRPILEYCLCILPLTRRHIGILDRTQNECLSKLMSVSRNTSYTSKQLIMAVPDMKTRRDELQASWYLRTCNLKGSHLIHECMRNDTWYYRKHGRRKRKIPFYGCNDNKLVQEYMENNTEGNIVHHIGCINTPTSGNGIPTSNRYAPLYIEDVFNVHTQPNVQVAVHYPEHIVKEAKKVKHAYHMDTYDKDKLKKIVISNRTKRVKQKLLDPHACVSVKNLVHLEPDGIQVPQLCRKQTKIDRRVKRMLILWTQCKFNRRDILCRNCSTNTPATMEHMIRCNEIPTRLRQLLNPKVKCMNHLLNAKMNSQSRNKYYKIAASLIYRMLKNSQGISISYLNNIEKSSINGHSSMSKNINNIIGSSISTNNRKRKYQSDVEEPLHESSVPWSAPINSADKKIPTLSDLDTFLASILSSTRSSKMVKRCQKLVDLQILRESRENEFKFAAKDRRAKKKAAALASQTTAPTAALIDSECASSSLSNTQISLDSLFASEVPPPSDIPTCKDISTSATPCNESATSLPATCTSIATKHASDDEDYSEGYTTLSTSIADCEERLRRFNIMAKAEMRKEKSMLRKDIFEDPRLLKYLANIDPNVVEIVVRKFIHSIKCLACNTRSLNLYNKERPMGYRIRCKVCTTSVFAAFYLPICYHANQVLASQEYNTPKAIKLDPLPTVLEDSFIYETTGADPLEKSQTSKGHLEMELKKVVETQKLMKAEQDKMLCEIRDLIKNLTKSPTVATSATPSKRTSPWAEDETVEKSLHQ